MSTLTMAKSSFLHMRADKALFAKLDALRVLTVPPKSRSEVVRELIESAAAKLPKAKAKRDD